MRTSIITLALLLGSTAFAAPPAGDHAGDAEVHGIEGEGPGHGPAGHGAAEHYYSADDDGDGTSNWADSDNDLFVVDDIGFHAFNVALLLAVLFYFTRRPIGDTVRERALGIRRELTDTARTRDEALKRYEEIDARLVALASEIETMRAEARQDAAVEEQKLIERAHAEAVRIGEMAERNIRDEVTRAQLELRKEAVELAVQLAETTLRQNVNHDDQIRLARDFLDSLNSEAANA